MEGVQSVRIEWNEPVKKTEGSMVRKVEGQEVTGSQEKKRLYFIYNPPIPKVIKEADTSRMSLKRRLVLEVRTLQGLIKKRFC